MTDNRTFDGVGRKIVDALKQQSGIEIQNVVNNASNAEETDFYENNISYSDEPEEIQYEEPIETPTINNVNPNFSSQYNFTSKQNFNEKESFAAQLDEFEVPANIAVLKQLINQLPAGVSKQTGAQIIKQTMEALGISMKNVLQEAQQVQESLNRTSRECQASIIEHKKHIGILERQAQKLQRQSAALNDIISLFVQTSL